MSYNMSVNEHIRKLVKEFDKIFKLTKENECLLAFFEGALGREAVCDIGIYFTAPLAEGYILEDNKIPAEFNICLMRLSVNI